MITTRFRRLRPRHLYPQEAQWMKRITDKVEVPNFHTARRANAGFGDGYTSHERNCRGGADARREIRPRPIGVVCTLHRDHNVRVGHDAVEGDHEPAFE